MLSILFPQFYNFSDTQDFYRASIYKALCIYYSNTYISHGVFQSHLKTFLFSKSFPP